MKCAHWLGVIYYRYEGGYLLGEDENRYIAQDLLDNRENIVDREMFDYCPKCGVIISNAYREELIEETARKYHA